MSFHQILLLLRLTVINVQRVIALRQFPIQTRFLAEVDATVKLAEAGQRCGSHPNDQILILQSVVVVVLPVEVPQILRPCDWPGKVLQSC